MPALLDDVRFAFQPLFNLNTGGVVAVEALARPHDGTALDLLQAAFRAGHLVDADVALACRAVRHAAEHEFGLPLHVNLMSMTVAEQPEKLEPLLRALHEVGRSPDRLVVELGVPYTRTPRKALLAGVRWLRDAGVRVALDGVGDGDVPLALLTDVAPDQLKLDRGIVVGLPDDGGRAALLTALLGVCEQTGSVLVAEGVETEAQLAALRRAGVRMAQGDLLAPARRRPDVAATIPSALAETADPEAVARTTPNLRLAGPSVTDFLHPATTLPETATAEEVREVLAAQPSVTGVVLVDGRGRPSWTLERNRFLLAVTGPFGHALHANREASRLADRPRAVGARFSALELLEVVTHGDRERANDDLVVVDEDDKCLGVVRVADVVRGVAELKVEQAASMNPLTRLPGSESIAREVERRVLAGEVFAVGWLDVDSFKGVNDRAGFAAGDDLIRAVGRRLAEGVAGLSTVRVGHVGGDDFLLVAGLDELIGFGAGVLDSEFGVDGLRVTLSLATLVCATGSVGSYREVSRLLAPLKRQAKSLSGSSWVLGRPGTDRVDVLRGGPHLAVG
ncbi:GGDEF domain-containing protein [Actinosynnema mirum]|uniref:Diguanylate cyclase/phosphodiesterase n=1 Tax=Actinosynnema mirum (strain ATCC 29888 / DSM 43827 / JCM 3225 / NBRC 14064 / NCIMB 13271 / NRRL B-12336 / IMRU 3971 / 101) TaxID=446462 RepID=C6W8B9_ACTMD|nr:GGDEF domain-containing protein [Actinosynnema mirum]ACU38966.1 diguanylate cyclase/phosphodiesterase [Actinosynnema mirum DSM 43827]